MIKGLIFNGSVLWLRSFQCSQHFACVSSLFGPRHFRRAAVVKSKRDGKELEETQSQAHPASEEASIPNLRFKVGVASAPSTAQGKKRSGEIQDAGVDISVIRMRVSKLV